MSNVECQFFAWSFLFGLIFAERGKIEKTRSIFEITFSDFCQQVCAHSKSCLTKCELPLSDITTNIRLSDQSCGISQYKEKFKKNKNMGRIVNGDFSGEHKYPWMASIRILNNDSGKYKHGCGGALINTRYVLTAGHCK